MTVRIAPSVLAADLGRLREQLEAVKSGGADWLHVDVMDGRFVPTISFGAPVVRALRRLSDLPLDVHLMVEEPERYVAEYAEAGARILTLHPEATIHLQRQLATIREHGMLAGVALNPASPLALLEDVWDDIDLVLLMTVNPGYGGQAYIPASTDKIRRCRALLDAQGSQAALEVDGGITLDTIGTAWEAGADTFVAGTAVFGDPDPAAATRALRRRCAVRV